MYEKFQHMCKRTEIISTFHDIKEFWNKLFNENNKRKLWKEETKDLGIKYFDIPHEKVYYVNNFW